MTQARTVDRPATDLENLESEVRSYCRTWTATFVRAVGDRIVDSDGRSYLDFFMGAGALNYGHSNRHLRRRLIDYLNDDGIVHGLDVMTEAKATFLHTLRERLLVPRRLDYKVQFTGPTGANSVEAALKLARKVTGRRTVVAFTRSFHGMSLGALAATANADKRAAAGVPLEHVLRLPYERFGGHGVCGLDLLEDLIGCAGSGVELPAAVIVETVQGEGGVNVASPSWLQRLAEICARFGVLLIVDDIQAGCGRTGPFFSFEPSGIVPDIVCLSKSLSGFGLPMAVTLFRRELDVWRPGEHNGTFRGSGPAFVTATEALERYWSNDELARATAEKEEPVAVRLRDLAQAFPHLGVTYRGRGLFWGVEFGRPGVATEVSRQAFDLGLLVETAGASDEVVKLLPSLLIQESDLVEGLEILHEATRRVAGSAA
ncbi:diaminobutyrate--2-oxoglutarate transaminase [Plantactinospora sp. B6F1]|uniref:diaminobutyrate--2-oxoglutarate transaminase n=1 Tax=Plantactinospora sp. B6F1 TaxID=3158971 RepID=UPI0032D94FCF